MREEKRAFSFRYSALDIHYCTPPMIHTKIAIHHQCGSLSSDVTHTTGELVRLQLH